MTSLLLLEDDDSRALEDVLAFLDEWHAGYANSRVSPGPARVEPARDAIASPSYSSPIDGDGSLGETDGSASSPPTTPVPAPVKVARKTTSDKRKDEIGLLRQQVAELHAHAELLRQLRRHAARDQTDRPLELLSASGLAKSAMLVAMWKDVAQRQKKLRAMSETENARLRSEVADQDMMLKAIRSMLKRRKRKSAHTCISWAVTATASVGAGDFRLLEQLCDRAEAEGFQIHERRPNLTAEIPEHSPVPQITQISNNKMRITFRENKVIPFAFVDIAAVLWDTVQQGCMSHGTSVAQVANERNGAIVRRYREECEFAGHTFKLDGAFAARPRHDFHQVGHVFGGLSKVFDIDGKPVSGISLSNRSAMVVSRAFDNFCRLEAMFHVEIELTSSLTSTNALHAKSLADAVARTNVDRYSGMLAQLESVMVSRPGGRTKC